MTSMVLLPTRSLNMHRNLILTQICIMTSGLTRNMNAIVQRSNVYASQGETTFSTNSG